MGPRLLFHTVYAFAADWHNSSSCHYLRVNSRVSVTESFLSTNRRLAGTEGSSELACSPNYVGVALTRTLFHRIGA